MLCQPVVKSDGNRQRGSIGDHRTPRHSRRRTRGGHHGRSPTRR
jgi:hypothetical protein